MHFLVGLCLLSLSAFANDDAAIQQVFQRYEQVLSQQKTELIPQVFSDKFLSEHGGEKAFRQELGKIAVPAYDLSIRPGQLDKDVMTVKMLPKGKPTAIVEQVFILKKYGKDWRIEGTLTNEE